VSCAFVDSGGHHTTRVYRYTKRRQNLHIYAIKGFGGEEKELICGHSHTHPIGNVLFNIGVDTAKLAMFARLRVGTPGAGYRHFPKQQNGEPLHGYDEVYFAGLTESEFIQTVRKRGYERFEWHKREHVRNEPLDIAGYGLAALRFMEDNGLKLDAIERLTVAKETGDAAKLIKTAKPKRPVGHINMEIEV